jgi:hypothetical protein
MTDSKNIIIKELKRISEEYGYYHDEEDTKVEEASWNYDRHDEPTEHVGLQHNSDLAILEDWSNERPVIPIEIVESLLKDKIVLTKEEYKKLEDKAWRYDECNK